MNWIPRRKETRGNFEGIENGRKQPFPVYTSLSVARGAVYLEREAELSEAAFFRADEMDFAAELEDSERTFAILSMTD